MELTRQLFEMGYSYTVTWTDTIRDQFDVEIEE